MKKCLTYAVLMIFHGILLAQDWPMINQNPQRTGYVAEEEKLFPPLQIDRLIDLGGIPSSMIVAEDVLYYLMDVDSTTVHAYSLDADHELWQFTIPGGAGTAGFIPALFEDLIYVGGQQGDALYALDRFSGEIRWSREIGLLYNHSPMPDGAGKLYVFADSLFCLDANVGSTIWSTTGNFSTPTLFANDIYYGNSEQFRSCNASNGEINWARNQNSNCTQVIANSSGIYTINDTTVCSYYFDAFKNWCYSFPTGIHSIFFSGGNAMLADTVLLFTALNTLDNVGMLIAINTNNGEKLWEYQSNSHNFFNPAGAHRVVYITGGDPSTIKGFDILDGTLLFEDTSRNFLRQPLIAGSRLFVPTYPGVMIFKSELTSVQPIRQTSIFTYYPNPFGQHINLKLDPALDGPCEIKLVSASGVVRKKIIMNPGQEYQWNTEGMSSGFYLLVITATNVQQVHKIIKIAY